MIFEVVYQQAFDGAQSRNWTYECEIIRAKQHPKWLENTMKSRSNQSETTAVDHSLKKNVPFNSITINQNHA